MSKQAFTYTLLTLSLLQTACSGGGPKNTQETESGNPIVSEPNLPPAGSITHYGAISLGDERGMLSDLLGSFYRLESGVDANFTASLYKATTNSCTIQSDDEFTFEDISAGFVPTIAGIDKTAVDAGENIIITSQDGTFSSLQLQSIADFQFYDVPVGSMLADTPIPDNLSIDIAGSIEIPAFSGILMPQVSSFSSPDTQVNEPITSASLITWQPASDNDAFIRISSSTAGGFFLDNSITVSCLTPDTGSFSFPPDIQQMLGADFSGSRPIISRVVVDTVQQDNTLLFVTRESFLN